ncbi:MAG: sigma-70 family RNA polymerase sigma factor [Candidatus Eisenbacteria bacterium]
MDPDETLVRAALAAPDGDTKAFAELVRRHQSAVLVNCRHLTRSRDDAEDLAQEVFVKLFFKLGTFEGRAKFSTWLQRIKVNHCLNFLQSKRGKTYVELSEPELAAVPELRVEDGALDGLDADRRRALIREVLDSLPDSLRVPLVMCDVDELSYEDIRRELGIGLSAVKMRIARARAEFRARWARATAGATAGAREAT